MSARWLARIVGIVMLLMFLLLLANLQKRLIEIQTRRPVRTTTSSTTGTP